MRLRVGQTLASTADSTVVMVIRAPEGEVSLTCGGAEMVDAKAAGTGPGAATGGDNGLKLGKRYVDAADRLELLCTKPGSAPVQADGNPLGLKEAKTLPSSD